MSIYGSIIDFYLLRGLAGESVNRTQRIFASLTPKILKTYELWDTKNVYHKPRYIRQKTTI